MWGRIQAAEAWNAASFFCKPESSQGEDRKKKIQKKFLVVETNKNDKASFKKKKKKKRIKNAHDHKACRNQNDGQETRL